jgi:hypothetical protein
MENENLFKSLYNICKKNNITSFMEQINFSLPAEKLSNLYQLNSIQNRMIIFLKKYPQNFIIKFITFLKNKNKKQSNYLILPLQRVITNSYNCHIVYKDIYDGFIYINKKEYLIYDKSLKTQLEIIKSLYLERISYE